MQAYRLKAKSLHPDKAAQQGISKETAERQFHDLAEAYEVHPCFTRPWFRGPWFKDPPVIETHRATSCASAAAGHPADGPAASPVVHGMNRSVHFLPKVDS